jgi:ribosome modulation factor
MAVLFIDAKYSAWLNKTGAFAGSRRFPMKKGLQLLLAALTCVPLWTHAALIYSGTLSSDDGDLAAESVIWSTGAKLTYQVDHTAGVFTYTYRLMVTEPSPDGDFGTPSIAVNNFYVLVEPSAPVGDFVISSGGALGIFDVGFMSDFYGIGWTGLSCYSCEFSITTARAPWLGGVVANAADDQNTAGLTNAMFDISLTEIGVDGIPQGGVPVPGFVPPVHIPEPGTLALVLLGAGMCLIRRRR